MFYRQSLRKEQLRLKLSRKRKKIWILSLITRPKAIWKGYRTQQSPMDNMQRSWLWHNPRKDTVFDRSKSNKRHARRVIEYEKCLGIKESLHTLILHVMEEPYLKALKEEYITYGSRTPFEIISHFCTKISKVTNKDKVQLKKEVFINWEQPQVLSAYFKQIEKPENNGKKWVSVCLMLTSSFTWLTKCMSQIGSWGTSWQDGRRQKTTAKHGNSASSFSRKFTLHAFTKIIYFEFSDKWLKKMITGELISYDVGYDCHFQSDAKPLKCLINKELVDNRPKTSLYCNNILALEDYMRLVNSNIEQFKHVFDTTGRH